MDLHVLYSKKIKTQLDKYAGDAKFTVYQVNNQVKKGVIWEY